MYVDLTVGTFPFNRSKSPLSRLFSSAIFSSLIIPSKSGPSAGYIGADNRFSEVEIFFSKVWVSTCTLCNECRDLDALNKKSRGSIGKKANALRNTIVNLVQIGSSVYYFTMLGLLPRSSAAVGYSVLLFVPKKPLLFGCTQCNEVVDTHFAINVVFTSSAAFSGVFFTLILVGFKGRNIAPNMAQCNSMPENRVSRFFR